MKVDGLLSPTAIRALLLSLVLSGAVLAAAQTGGAPPTVKLPPLRPRPGYIIGRAVFADGRPVPDFQVTADTVASGAGKVEGSNGLYALRITDPYIAVVQHVLGYAHLPYHGQTYVLQMHPMDGLPDGSSTNKFLGYMSKGVVRDFVFRLTGNKPGSATNPPPKTVTNTDEFSNALSFEGCPIQIETNLGGAISGSGTLEVTLTPTGPLIDGSTGAVVHRTIPNGQANGFYYLYDIPLGVYNTSVGLVGPGGAARPLRIQMRVYGTPVTSGPTPQESVSITWPYDSGTRLVGRPVLALTP